MRIGIDLRFTAASCMGTGTYAETATLSLADHASTDHLIGFVDDPLVPGPLASAVHQRGLSPFHGGRQSMDAQRLLFDAAIDRERLDVFFAPAGIGPRALCCPVVTTVHDILFEHQPACFGEPLLHYLRREVPRSLRTADLVLAISEATKRDVQRRYGIPDERIRVLHQPLRHVFRTKPSPAAIATSLRALGLETPYLLTLTNHAPHKNSAFLLPLFAQWLRRTRHPTCRLVIAGGGLAPQAPVDLRGLASQFGIEDRVIITGRIPDHHLPALLAGAMAFLYPSLFEGWGLPPLEAIAMGTPVIVSDRGALPEAVGDAGVVLPLDEHQWSEALDVLTTTPLPDRMASAMRRRADHLLTANGAQLRAILAEAIERPRPRSTSGIITSVPNRRGEAPVTASPRLRKPASLSGCMIIRNGIRLGYPFVEAIQAVIDHVDEMVVVDGHSDDETWSVLQRMAAACPRLRISQHAWPSTTRGGHAIAAATNQALRLCRSSHILAIQADEIHATANLVRLRELLHHGIDYAAMPFLHFRTGWWSLLKNPAYTATIRCVPNHPEVTSIDDGTTFRGPPGRCAPPDAFPDFIYHVGWVYAANVVAKHQNHAVLYTDHESYQAKASKAARLSDAPAPDQLAAIDAEYELTPFLGTHPSVIAHLLTQERYEVSAGLERWFSACRRREKSWRSHASASPLATAGAVP